MIDIPKGVRKTVPWPRGEQFKTLPGFKVGVAIATVGVAKPTSSSLPIRTREFKFNPSKLQLPHGMCSTWKGRQPFSAKSSKWSSRHTSGGILRVRHYAMEGECFFRKNSSDELLTASRHTKTWEFTVRGRGSKLVDAFRSGG